MAKMTPFHLACSLEVHSELDGQPSSVLLHQPQRHQDVPAIEGEQCLPQHTSYLNSIFDLIKKYKIGKEVLLILF